jgi:cyclopropane fatty-acyl-phospholipid synthase-like methyltransferase
MDKLCSEAAVRNAPPIAAVLARVLPRAGTVLEIASGSGQHVVHFARAFPHLRFQPTDKDQEALRSIEAWRAEAGAENILPALALDVTRSPWPTAEADAILNINMIHISPWEACQALFRGAATLLNDRGLLYLYGPFRIDGRPTAPSNEVFDASLRARNPAWGLRTLGEVERLAETEGFFLEETVDMPANNLSVVFRKRAV